MQAIREIVNREIFTGYDVPKEFGDEFEMILVPIKQHDIYNSGFINNVLNSKSEDVWNEKIENQQFLAATYNSVIEDNDTEDEIWSKYL